MGIGRQCRHIDDETGVVADRADGFANLDGFSQEGVRAGGRVQNQ